MHLDAMWEKHITLLPKDTKVEGKNIGQNANSQNRIFVYTIAIVDTLRVDRQYISRLSYIIQASLY